MKTNVALVLFTSLAIVGTAGGCKRSAPTAGSSGEAATPSTVAAAGELDGTYKITAASNPGGAGTYSGSVTLKRTGGSYQLAWDIPGSPGYSGVAIPVGSTLGVGWGMGAHYGVAVYQVNGGSLKGKWATALSPDVGTEDLEGPPGLNGTYKITKAAGPDGKGYEGNVAIAPKGQTFEVTWTLPTESYSGVGIQEGDLLIVGWGEAGKGAGVVSYKINGATLAGRWGAPGAPQLGTESLTKQ
jgi:hypothetical protein